MKYKISDAFEDSIGLGCLCVFLALILVVGLFFLEGLILWALWNGVLAVALAFINPISYWAALGIMIICNILFKGVRCCCHRD